MRRARVERIGARDPQRDVVAALAYAVQPLAAKAALAHARIGDHDDGARDALALDLFERCIERQELAVAAETRHRDAEELPRFVARSRLRDELEPGVALADVEARSEQARRGLVDADGHRAGARRARRIAYELRGAVDRAHEVVGAA